MVALSNLLLMEINLGSSVFLYYLTSISFHVTKWSRFSSLKLDKFRAR